MYSSFAEFYDSLTTNISYEARAKYFKKLIEKFFGKAELVLDLACGTGNLSFELEKLGYDVTAVDISEEMLMTAREKAMTEESHILFLCQDMSEIDLYGTMDAVVCALDSLNHLTNGEDVGKTFLRLSNFVTDNGVFIFDVNTLYKHQRVLGNNTFVYDTDEVYCVWQNNLSDEDDSVVDICLDFFETDEEDPDCYYRSQEIFSEKAYSIDELEKWLNEAEFDIKAIYDEDSENPPTDISQRLIIVAQRRKR